MVRWGRASAHGARRSIGAGSCAAAPRAHARLDDGGGATLKHGLPAAVALQRLGVHLGRHPCGRPGRTDANGGARATEFRRTELDDEAGSAIVQKENTRSNNEQHTHCVGERSDSFSVRSPGRSVLDIPVEFTALHAHHDSGHTPCLRRTCNRQHHVRVVGVLPCCQAPARHGARRAGPRVATCARRRWPSCAPARGCPRGSPRACARARWPACGAPSAPP